MKPVAGRFAGGQVSPECPGNELKLPQLGAGPGKSIPKVQEIHREYQHERQLSCLWLPTGSQRSLSPAINTPDQHPQGTEDQQRRFTEQG